MNGRGMKTEEPMFHSLAVHSSAYFRPVGVAAADLPDPGVLRQIFAAHEDSDVLQCRDRIFVVFFAFLRGNKIHPQADAP